MFHLFFGQPYREPEANPEKKQGLKHVLEAFESPLSTHILTSNPWPARLIRSYIQKIICFMDLYGVISYYKNMLKKDPSSSIARKYQEPTSFVFFIITGWWFGPLWKIWKSIGMISRPIYGKIELMATKPPTRLELIITGMLSSWINHELWYAWRAEKLMLDIPRIILVNYWHKNHNNSKGISPWHIIS